MGCTFRTAWTAGVDVIRRWGRLGVRTTCPRQLAEPYPDWTEARGALEDLLVRRAARGYRGVARNAAQGAMILARVPRSVPLRDLDRYRDWGE